MRKSEIEEANRYQVARQREFRAAADVVAAALIKFPEVVAIGVTGSAAKPLWKEVPRFREFRHAGIEIWHECFDLNLAVWIERLDRLGELRRARDLALLKARESQTGVSVASHQAEIFLFAPGSDSFLGKLCDYNQCPKGKLDCLVPGCGAVLFNKIIAGFVPLPDLLATARRAMLFDRKSGLRASALDLPGPQE